MLKRAALWFIAICAVGLTVSPHKTANAEAVTLGVVVFALERIITLTSDQDPDMNQVYGRANYVLLQGVHDRLDHIENIAAKSLIDISRLPQINRENIKSGLVKHDVNTLYGLHERLVNVYLSDGEMSEYEKGEFRDRFAIVGSKIDGATASFKPTEAIAATIHALIDIFHAQEVSGENLNEVVRLHKGRLETLLSDSKENSITKLILDVDAAIKEKEAQLGLTNQQEAKGKWLGAVDYGRYRWNFLCTGRHAGYDVGVPECSIGSRAHYYKDQSRLVLPVIHFNLGEVNGIPQIIQEDCVKKHSQPNVNPEEPITLPNRAEKSLGCYVEYPYSTLLEWQEERFKAEKRYKVAEVVEGTYPNQNARGYNTVPLQLKTLDAPPNFRQVRPIEPEVGNQSDLYGRLPFPKFKEKMQSQYDESESLAFELNDLYQARAVLGALQRTVERLHGSLHKISAKDILVRASVWQKSYPALEDLYLFHEREQVKHNAELVKKMLNTREIVARNRQLIEGTVSEAIAEIQSNRPTRELLGALRIIQAAYQVADAFTIEKPADSSTEQGYDAEKFLGLSEEPSLGEDLEERISTELREKGVEVTRNEVAEFGASQRSLASIELSLVKWDPMIPQHMQVRKQINELQEKRLSGYEDLKVDEYADYEVQAMITLGELAEMPLNEADQRFLENKANFNKSKIEVLIDAIKQGVPNVANILLGPDSLAPGEVMDAQHRASLMKNLTDELTAIQQHRSMLINNTPRPQNVRILLDVLPQEPTFKPAP